MSAQTSSTEELPTGTAQPENAPRAWRILALTAVCLGVAALAAATFVLSYSGIRAVALQAGIAPKLARGYPLLVDAMLVIALAAVLALRSAGLPSKMLAWLTLLVVLAAAAGADALHAAGRKLPHNPAAITAAVLPWALVLIAFALLLAMLRHARLRRLAAVHGREAPDGPERTGLTQRSTNMPALELPGRQPQPPASASIMPGLPAPPATGTAAIASPAIVQPVLAVPRQPGPVAVGASDPSAGDPERELPDLAVDTDLASDDPSSDEAAAEPADGTTPYPAESSPPAAAADDADPDMPVFHRMWSSPTPPAGR